LLSLVLLATLTTAPTPDPDEALRRAFLAHDVELLGRDATLVSGKYARMAHSKFAYFRGTAWRTPREPSHFLTPAAAQLAVLGDPHVENVGLFGPRGKRRAELIDFDLAGYGSYIDDLRRLSLSLWIIADMADLKHKQRPRVVEEVVSGYLEEVHALSRAEPPAPIDETTLPQDLDDVFGPPPDDETRELPASPADEALAREALRLAPATMQPAPPASALAVKRVTRRQAGVSSFPLLRLHVVVEGPTPSPGDDWTLELKQSARPAAPIIAIQRQYQDPAAPDRLLGWARTDGRELRVRRIFPDQRRLDAEKMAKQVKSPRWAKRDLKTLAGALGRLLARGHARALGRDGHPGLSALNAAITSDEGLRQETIAVVEKQGAASVDDYHRFQHLLRTQGPLLGWK
jgi:hypothetical protein